MLKKKNNKTAFKGYADRKQTILERWAEDEEEDR